MRYHAKVRANCEPFLPTGEEFRAAFPAMGGPLIGMATRYRVVVVTNCHVHLYSAAWFSICKPKNYIRTHPLGWPLVARNEPVLNKVLHVAGERLWVKYAHHRELNDAIDASHQLVHPATI